MTDEQKMRAEFDYWWNRHGRFNADLEDPDQIEAAWTGWQAALSHASATAEECSVVPTNSPEIGSKLVDADAKVTAFRNRFISERTTTWLRDGLDYEMARAKAEADANEYEQAFDQAIAAKTGDKP